MDRRVVWIETPKAAKDFFAGFLFPCKGAGPSLPQGKAWQASKANSYRGTKAVLCGLDLEQAGLAIAAFDTHSAEFKASKAAQAFKEKCRRVSAFRVRTPRGGQQFFFKGQAPAGQPFPGAEIKSAGAFIFLYNLPFKEGAFESFEDFYEALPQWPFPVFKVSNPAERASGPAPAKAPLKKARPAEAPPPPRQTQSHRRPARSAASPKKESRPSEAGLAAIIRREAGRRPQGTWEAEKYIKWAKEILGIGENKARRLLKSAGRRSKPKGAGGAWFIY